MMGLSTFLEESASTQRNCASSFDTSCCSCSPLLKARLRQHYVVDGSVVKLSVSDSELLGSNNEPVFVQCVGRAAATPPIRHPERRGVRRLHSNDRSTIAPLVLSSSFGNSDDGDADNNNKQHNSSSSYCLCNSQTPPSPRRRILRPSSPQRKRRLQQLKQMRSHEQEHNQQLKARHQGISKREQLLGPDNLYNIANHCQEIASMRPHQRKIRWNTSLPQVRSPRASRIQGLQLEDLSLHMRAKRVADAANKATTTTTTTATTATPSEVKDDVTPKVTKHAVDDINKPLPQAASESKNNSDPPPQVAEKRLDNINMPLAQIATKSKGNEMISDPPLQVAEDKHGKINTPLSQAAKCVCDKTHGDDQCVRALKDKIDKLTKSLQRIRREIKRDGHVSEKLQKQNAEIRQDLANMPPVCSQSVADFTQTIDMLQQKISQIDKQLVYLTEQKTKSNQKADNSSKRLLTKSPIKSKQHTIDKSTMCHTGSKNQNQKSNSNKMDRPAAEHVKFDDSCSNESSMPLLQLQLRSDRGNPTEETGASRYHFDLFVPPL